MLHVEAEDATVNAVFVFLRTHSKAGGTQIAGKLLHIDVVNLLY